MKPFTIGQLFSCSFKLYGKDFWKMFLTAVVSFFVVIVPVIILTVWTASVPEFEYYSYSPYGLINSIFTIGLDFLIIVGVIIVTALAVYPFMESIILILSSSRLKGKPLMFRQAFSLATEKYGRLIITMLCNALMYIPLILIYIFLFGCVFSSIFAAPFYSFDEFSGFSGFGPMFAIVPVIILIQTVLSAAMVYLGIVLKFSMCAVINEDKFGFTAVGRAFKLVSKGGFWRNIGHYLLITLAAGAAYFIVSLVTGIFTMPAFFIDNFILFSSIFSSLISVLFASAAYSLPAIYIQLMYFNSRIRAEGYSLI